MPTQNSDSTALLNSVNSTLLILDLQEKLIPVIKDGKRVKRACEWMFKLAQHLSIPTLITEHSPIKLGEVVYSIRDHIADEQIFKKHFFSAIQDPNIGSHLLSALSDQVVLVGVETHVCLLQTSLDLLKNGKQVFVVADATGTRNQLDKDFALERMRGAGAIVVTREMAAYEWLTHANSQTFHDINKDLIKPGSK